jgi:hypothetical protein
MYPCWVSRSLGMDEICLTGERERESIKNIAMHVLYTYFSRRLLAWKVTAPQIPSPRVIIRCRSRGTPVTQDTCRSYRLLGGGSKAYMYWKLHMFYPADDIHGMFANIDGERTDQSHLSRRLAV